MGKLQPFSTFPVYSHIPPTSEYYYITNENDVIIPIKENFNFSGGELHKMIEYRYESYAKTYGDPKILLKVGTETLDFLFTENQINTKTVPHSMFKIWNAKVSVVDNKISVKAIVIASKPVE
ncbi:MAG: hypothetical protein JKX73_05215 [Flavobacteriales bacterium]|nr:hypothetical protein [Flavobacteriales bacterium]